MWEIETNSFVRDTVNPVYFTLNDFTDSSLCSFRKACFKAHDLGQGILPIEVGTYGGDSTIMSGYFSLIDEFRSRGMKFAGICPSRAMSAGFYVFAYCDKGLRFIGSHGICMVHGTQMGTGGRLSEAKNLVDFLHLEEINFFKKMSKHLGKRPEWLEKELKKRSHEDWNISSEDAVKMGFADHIKIPVWKMTMDCKFGYT